MKYTGLVILFFFLFGPPTVLQKGKDAFASGRYAESIPFWEASMEKYPEYTAPMRYNIAQSWAALDSGRLAAGNYEKVVTRTQPEVSSMALNQFGCMQFGYKRQELEAALAYFKNALKYDYHNDTARYNYELVKKMLNHLPPDTQPPVPPPPPPPEEENQNIKQQPKPKPVPKEGEGTKPEYEPMSVQELKQMLDAISTQEKQFVQQLRKTVKSRENPGGVDY